MAGADKPVLLREAGSECVEPRKCGLRREQEPQAADFGERAEVTVAGDEGKAGIETELGDHAIGEASTAGFRENFCAERSGALPKTGLDLD